MKTVSDYKAAHYLEDNFDDFFKEVGPVLQEAGYTKNELTTDISAKSSGTEKAV
jgi:hypothetical protein